MKYDIATMETSELFDAARIEQDEGWRDTLLNAIEYRYNIASATAKTGMKYAALEIGRRLDERAVYEEHNL